MLSGILSEHNVYTFYAIDKDKSEIQGEWFSCTYIVHASNPPLYVFLILTVVFKLFRSGILRKSAEGEL